MLIPIDQLPSSVEKVSQPGKLEGTEYWFILSSYTKIDDDIPTCNIKVKKAANRDEAMKIFTENYGKEENNV